MFLKLKNVTLICVDGIGKSEAAIKSPVLISVKI
jgi:hypothetical protein